MQSKAKTVEAYIDSLPTGRRDAIQAVRKIILENLPEGYTELMQYGMISYVIPLERLPNTYNGQPLPIASLASQKNYMSLYLMGVYGDKSMRDWFTKSYKASGKKLDMGQSCVRFRNLGDLPLNVIAEAIAKYRVEDLINAYERSHGSGK